MRLRVPPLDDARLIAGDQKRHEVLELVESQRIVLHIDIHVVDAGIPRQGARVLDGQIGRAHAKHMLPLRELLDHRVQVEVRLLGRPGGTKHGRRDDTRRQKRPDGTMTG